MVQPIVTVGLLVVAILFSISLYRAYVVFKPCSHELVYVDDTNRLNLTKVQLDRLLQSLRIPTISFSTNVENLTAKQEHLNYIRKEFAELETYSYVKLEIVNGYSMLYKISGTNNSLKPYLLAAHLDVVPVEEGINEWTFEPFSAHLHTDDNIYARGTMDDKSSMLALLEATSIFLKRHGQPIRTIYLAFGHDEEITGKNGAGRIAKLMKDIQLEYVLDEGTIMVDNAMAGLKKPLATIGVADKGYMTVRYFVNVTGGHSSMPEASKSAIFIIADALAKIKANQIPSRLGSGPEKDMLEQLSSYMPFAERLFLSNIWLFKPILKAFLSGSPTLNAFQRTTTAATIIRAGSKDNVIPKYAEAIVNYRIHSSQSCAEIIDYHMKAIGDSRVENEIIECVEPSPISPTSGLGYTQIEHATRQIYPDVVVIPGVMLGLTDSRFYNTLTKNVYKFMPIRVDNDDLKRYHGIDERISLKNYENLINFYFCLIDNTNKAHLEKMNRIHEEF